MTVTAYLIYAKSIHLPRRALLWQFHPLIHFQLLLTPLSSIFRISPTAQVLNMPFKTLYFHLCSVFSRGSDCRPHWSDYQIMILICVKYAEAAHCLTCKPVSRFTAPVRTEISQCKEILYRPSRGPIILTSSWFFSDCRKLACMSLRAQCHMTA